MTSPASIAKHPIHPMLVGFPIGLWVFSLVCDFIYRVQHTPIWSELAFYTIAGGIIGALLAAVPGLIDFSSLRHRAQKLGIAHMIINLVVVALYCWNFWLRSVGTQGRAPLALSVVAVILLAISGWLGGEMVYVHGVAVQPAPPEPASPRTVAPPRPAWEHSHL
jgi:uncharacterized membrane protein